MDEEYFIDEHMMQDVLGIVLAAGPGIRMRPLTNYRPKPAVPWAAMGCLIDHVLANMVNSKLRHIYILSGENSHTLNEYINDAWLIRPSFRSKDFISVIGAQQVYAKEKSAGNVETLLNNRHLLNIPEKKIIAVYGSDHISQINIAQIVKEHIEKKADVTLMGSPMKIEDIPKENPGTLEERLAYGIIDVDSSGFVRGFQEKPLTSTLTAKTYYISLGNYLFGQDVLWNNLTQEMADIGGDFLPMLIQKGCAIYMHNYLDNKVPGMVEEYEKGFFLDGGTVDRYMSGSKVLVKARPEINIGNKLWPAVGTLPSKTVHEAGWSWDPHSRRGQNISSLVGSGVQNSGGCAHQSIIFPEVHIHSYSLVDNSVIFPYVDIGERCKVYNSIVEVNLPPGTEIGYNLDDDRARGIQISAGDVRVVRQFYDFAFKEGFDPKRFIKTEDFATTGILHPI